LGSTLATARPTGRRRHDLDLIRMTIVVGLVFFHTALIFDPGDYYVDNRPPNYFMTLCVFFVQLWGMPLMFIVAGAGVWHSLRARTPRAFVLERLRRLLVPLLVGIALVVPPQVYFSLLASNQDPGPYWQFLGRFFDLRLAFDFPGVVHSDDPDQLFEMAHLWFLWYLLIYSLLLLPAVLFLQRGLDRRLMARLLRLCRRPGGSFLLVLPIAAIEGGLGTWDTGGWNGYAYLPFLGYGFLIAASRQLATTIREQWRQVLAVAVAVLPLLFVIAHFDIGGPDRNLGRDYDHWSVVWRLLKATAGWAWAIAIFGWVSSLARPVRGPDASPASGDGGRLLTGVGRYANEAVLPFYVLHQTAIVVIGFYVVQWQVGVLSKYTLISVASLVSTLAIYELCIRRANPTRVLFGMRRLPPPP